jgi:hypothetical protein
MERWLRREQLYHYHHHRRLRQLLAANFLRLKWCILDNSGPVYLHLLRLVLTQISINKEDTISRNTDNNHRSNNNGVPEDTMQQMDKETMELRGTQMDTTQELVIQMEQGASTGGILVIPR